MLAKLFKRLTGSSETGEALFDWVTRTSRDRDWYLAGDVPDTIDGRFAMVATIAALTFVRLEDFGSRGDPLSVALAERFAQVMESEHRELGLGDPTLGKTVLKLVGSLSQRVALWRDASSDPSNWGEASRKSVPGSGANAAALSYRAKRLKAIADLLRSASLEELAAGDLA